MSDLHLEAENFHPEHAPGADLLVLAGDIDARWHAFEQFRNWPVPVIFVAGNHEFDRRDIAKAWPQLKALCKSYGIHPLEQDVLMLDQFPGVNFVGCTRWCNFDLLGEALRDKAMRAAKHYIQSAGMSRSGKMVDAQGIREMSMEARTWLEHALSTLKQSAAQGTEKSAEQSVAEQVSIAQKIVVITHFAPSQKSADPRYGLQPGTAGFCNQDEDLMQGVDLWMHGHLHCPSRYKVGDCQVWANPRGYIRKDEAVGFNPNMLIELV
jgi:DNA repair exonuclease SbcCD nuclease subunit